MAIQVQTLTVSDAQRLLSLDEGHYLDFKAIEVKPAKLTESISAFANADGGELYIGIDEDKVTQKRRWRGFSNQEAANGHLQPFESLFPLGQDFEYVFLKCSGWQGLLLKVSISKTRDIKKASDGQVYIRRGAQKLTVGSHEQLKQLEFTKGISSFETELVNVDCEYVTESAVVKDFIKSVVPRALPCEWLQKQQLIRQGKPTVAAIVLFADEPQALIQKHCGIKLYRYKTDELEGSRETMAFQPKNLEGCAYNQIKTAVDETIAVVEEIKKLGATGLEKIEYPRETLHEIITNAVIHRDYSIADDIHIRVFDNRIEVDSPGRLPAHITEQNMLAERFARNGTIVRIINKFPDAPNKDIGEGMNTAFAAMRKLRLKDPQIKQKDHSVQLNIRHEPLASPEELILSFLDSHDTIKNKTAHEICSIGSENKIKSVFNRLIKAGKIEKIKTASLADTSYRKIRP